MFEVYMRPLYQAYFVNHIAKWVKRVPPARITLLGCLSGIMIVPSLMFNCPKIAILFLLVSGFLDMLDGAVARERGMTSNNGAMLDIVSDRIVEFAIIFGLFLVDPTNRATLVLAMLGSCYICVTTFLIVGMHYPRQVERGYLSPGLIERLEAFIFFILMMTFPAYFSLLAMIFIVSVFVTSYLYVKQFMQHEAKQHAAVLREHKAS